MAEATPDHQVEHQGLAPRREAWAAVGEAKGRGTAAWMSMPPRCFLAGGSQHPDDIKLKPVLTAAWPGLNH